MSHLGTLRRGGRTASSAAAASIRGLAVDDLGHSRLQSAVNRSAPMTAAPTGAVVVQRPPDVVARRRRIPGAARDAEIAARPRQRHVEDFLDPALAHDHDAVGDQHRLVEIVGDEQDGLAGARHESAAARPASSRGSARRARRTARPSAAPWDRWRARGRCRRAAACRRTIGAGGDRVEAPRPTRSR